MSGLRRDEQVDQVGNLGAFLTLDETGEMTFTTFSEKPVRLLLFSLLISLPSPGDAFLTAPSSAAPGHQAYGVRSRVRRNDVRRSKSLQPPTLFFISLSLLSPAHTLLPGLALHPLPLYPLPSLSPHSHSTAPKSSQRRIVVSLLSQSSPVAVANAASAAQYDRQVLEPALRSLQAGGQEHRFAGRGRLWKSPFGKASGGSEPCLSICRSTSLESMLKEMSGVEG